MKEHCDFHFLHSKKERKVFSPINNIIRIMRQRKTFSIPTLLLGVVDIRLLDGVGFGLG